MAYWLVKSEPHTWSWQDQVKAGSTHWDGVRNYQASNNMKEMTLGDQVLFYHSGKERAIVGIVEVAKEYYPDPSDEKGRFGMVDVKTVKPLAHPVTLKDIKEQVEIAPALADLALVRQPRLSVMPVTKEQWHILIGLAKDQG